MAVGFASSTLTDDTALLLSGLRAELRAVFPARIQHAQLAAALDELRAHDALQRGAADAAGRIEELLEAHPLSKS